MRPLPISPSRTSPFARTPPRRPAPSLVCRSGERGPEARAPSQPCPPPSSPPPPLSPTSCPPS
eukprot:1091488-Pyramimonas_sp.AAC.1